MALIRRGKIWWIDLATPGSGERVRRSTGTDLKELAQEYHDRTKADLWKQAKLKEKPIHTWEEAASRWFQSRSGNPNAKNNLHYIRWLTSHLKNRPLRSIDKDLIDSIAEKKAKDKRTGHLHKSKGSEVSPGTVNRYLACLRAILRAAWEWGWLEAVPPVSLHRSTQKRIRFLTREEASRLMSCLPDHLQPIVSFALATGLRQKNILDLEWSQIDREKGTLWIHGDQAKGGRDIRIPLNAEAMRILDEEDGNHQKYVFVYRGRPLGSIGSAFERAVKKAKVGDFRFHDLRHTWASWHVQNGTPLAVLQELGGWASLSMVQRYAHLGESHLKMWADNLSNDTITAQLKDPKSSK